MKLHESSIHSCNKKSKESEIVCSKSKTPIFNLQIFIINVGEKYEENECSPIHLFIHANLKLIINERKKEKSQKKTIIYIKLFTGTVLELFTLTHLTILNNPSILLFWL